MVIVCIILVADTKTLFSQHNYSIEEILERCLKSYEGVADYTYLLHKKEMIKGELIEQKNIMCKFRKPLSVYMKWTEGKDKGTESIYVKGKYDNKLMVHLTMLGGVKMSLNPKGYFAMKNNRHSILEANLGHIIELIKKNYDMSKINGEGSITFEGEQILDKKLLLVFKAVFPEGKGYYGHKMFIYIDKQLYLPVKTVVYGWDGELWEMYYYSNIKTNVGLFDKDFDVDNPEYDF